ncbi:ATP-binding protein [Streptomyces sp. NBC_00249]|uniref:DEAD/DEAH box helicase n=1 Tax=Streptomyces sp. NBC_00249 TaxID=2975690 RepID=UPI002255C512|nr:AAA domain-containing protein [Streptomyces sp. NBC_00249]MCX5199269.1 ATP-binding protein [Streptomyces sp. NBC_00249]
MGGERRRRSGVVGYWRAVELFSPQKIPGVSVRERVYAAVPGEPAPWEAGHPLRSVPLEPGYGWQHVVYGGAFALSAVRDTLLDVFGESGEDHDGRMDGETALFALTVTDEGRLLLDSPVFSSCAWATGRAVTPGPGSRGWLDGFEEEAGAWGTLAGELGEPGGYGGPGGVADGDAGDGDSPVGAGVVSAAHLLEFTGELARAWGVSVALAPAGVRVRSVAVRLDQAEGAGNADQQDFLNSFIAADLDRVARALERSDPGPGLAAYLTPSAAFDPSLRTDLRRHPEAALAGVSPDRTPAGRWPADARHALALSQQFAVNAVHAELAPGAGIFAVNGPPGTGKTTMLRDCFAAAVVERAGRLAALRLPSEAFDRGAAPYVWKSGDYTRTVTPLRPEFTGFEMVVASANNGAVENISTEIPARAALGEPWREDADYFAEQATRLLKGDPAWGAVAARLGSKRNRLEFVNRFWHGKYRRTDANASPPASPVPSVPPQSRRGGRPNAWIDSGNGLSHLLRQWRDTPQTGVWSEGRKRFGAALAEVERLRAERSEAAAAFTDRAAAYEALRRAQDAVGQDTAAVARAREALAPAEAALGGVQQSLADAEHTHQAHLARRPGFTVSLFTLGRAARDWHAQEAEAAGAVATARQAREAAQAHLDGVRAAVGAAEARLRAGQQAAEAAGARAERAERAIAAARARWEGFVPEESWLTDDSLRERSAPWSDPEITAARTELFLAALHLHQAFLRCTARTMYANLMAAMDAVTGAVPHTVPETHLRAAWQSLFLLVPVVSTTFASLDRVFGRLGPQALGWLFVDEAGQATPQMAVGGMWRARRTVVVGDPLQLEPVVVLPWTAQRALRDDFGVAEEWAPGRTSVQQLADRANRYGTLLPAELPGGGHEVWVGSPLRVHRRCDDPMFSVSNAIAYDGLMVQGVDAGTREPYVYRPASSWVDVAGAQADGHWIPEEGRALRRVLERLREEGGVDLARDVFVISPFRQVVAGAKRACRDLVPGERVGTVHTTQGKEADVVILVLGTDPRRAGARAWAASRPNLLNVAVSRAKRRLFVIGNREAWRDQRHFSTLAESLPAHTWQPQRQEQPGAPTDEARGNEGRGR